MLSQNGFEVEDRSAAEPIHRAELEALGYQSAPVIVLGSRIFAGFPEENVRREIGLPAADFTYESTLVKLRSALAMLRHMREVTAAIPDRFWWEQMYANRDHPLGHFVWSIYRFVRLVIETPAKGEFAYADLKPSLLRTDWPEEEKFRTFAALTSFADEMIAELAAWERTLTPESLDSEVDTPWGRVSMHSLIGILNEHTSLKFSLLFPKLAALDPDFPLLPTADLLRRFPAFEPPPGFPLRG